ncbi:hypothetical protein ACFFIX_16915 [Metabacillus herbersteinensis]|uniref:Uncharacterized protein n=1 Tax=Metabacillus herbersteinensis TaxID=283816 RepID=A0ABV6GHE9_9BACI
MYRFVSFVLLSSIISILLYFHNENGHQMTSGHHENHQLEAIELPKGHKVPSIKGSVKQNASGSWLLHLETENFTFTPEKADSNELQYNQGHAHLYVNGEKIKRLYRHSYQLGNLKEGPNQIKVTLNTTTHGVLTFHNKEIAYYETVEVIK